MKGKVLAGVAVAACLFLNSGLASAKLFVEKSNQARKSITVRLSKAKSGDSIEIQAGVYKDVANGGYETFPLQMKAGVALIGTNAENSIVSAADFNAIEGDSAGVTIENLTIKSNLRPIFLDRMSTADAVSVKNSIIQGGQSGIITLMLHKQRGWP